MWMNLPWYSWKTSASALKRILLRTDHLLKKTMMHTKLDTSIEMESLPIIMLISGSDMLHDSVDCFVCVFNTVISPVDGRVEVFNKQSSFIIV